MIILEHIRNTMPITSIFSCHKNGHHSFLLQDDTPIIFSLRAHSGVDPPDPIPNSEVKHACADDT